MHDDLHPLMRLRCRDDKGSDTGSEPGSESGFRWGGSQGTRGTVKVKNDVIPVPAASQYRTVSRPRVDAWDRVTAGHRSVMSSPLHPVAPDSTGIDIGIHCGTYLRYLLDVGDVIYALYIYNLQITNAMLNARLYVIVFVHLPQCWHMSSSRHEHLLRSFKLRDLVAEYLVSHQPHPKPHFQSPDSPHQGPPWYPVYPSKNP